MDMETKTPIAWVVATIQFPLYAGDRQDCSWEWFQYREPGITANGDIGTCTRDCETLKAEVHPVIG